MKQYLIILHNDARGRWQFRFQAPNLPKWKQAIIRLVGWECTELP